jgi:hypothetical protein
LFRATNIDLLGTRVISNQSGKRDEQDQTFHAVKLTNEYDMSNKRQAKGNNERECNKKP